MAVRTETAANSILTKLLGVGAAGFFGHLDFMEMKKAEPSTTQLAIFSGVVIFGIALALTDSVVSMVRQLAPLVGPYLPFGKHDR